MPARSTHTIPAILSLLCAALACLPARGQSPPPNLGLNITTAVDLNDAQIQEIKRYVDYWTAPFGNAQASPADVQRAREKLLEPLGGPSRPSPRFRLEYSTLATPRLSKAINETNIHVSVNALMVLARLGSDEALRLLMDHADARRQPAWQIRVHGAMGAKAAFGAGELSADKIINAARRLGDLAQREENNLVLLRLFEAMDAADRQQLKPEEREQIRMSMVEAMASVARRIAKEGNPHTGQSVEALGRAINLLRDKWVSGQVPSGDQPAIARTLVPALTQLLQSALTNWEALQADQSAKDLWAVIIGNMEGFVPFMQPRLPKTELRQAWEQGDKEKFQRDVTAWTGVTGVPQ